MDRERSGAGALAATALALTLVAGCGGDDRRTDAGTGRDAGTDGATTDAGPVCLPSSAECSTTGTDCCTGLVCRGTTRLFCVTPDDTCFVGAETGCCLDDADCADGQRCHLAECRLRGDGMCEPAAESGTCWSDRDCAAGEMCAGATVCGCGEVCFVADAPGTCG